MSEMVERVAEAIWPDAFAGDGAGWHQRRDVARDQARAAIKAMREPTPGIIQVGSDYMPGAGYAENAWRNMIDECLR